MKWLSGKLKKGKCDKCGRFSENLELLSLDGSGATIICESCKKKGDDVNAKNMG